MINFNFFKKQFSFFAILFLLLTSLQAFCEEPLEVGVTNFPPFYIINKTNSNDVKGYLTDILKKVLTKAEIKHHIKGYPPKRLYKNVATGKTNIWLGTKNVPVYEKEVLYSKQQVTSIELRVYTVGDKPLLKTKKDLVGKELITIMGYGYGGLVKFLKDPKNKIKTDESSTHKSAFMKLMYNRRSYLLNYSRPAKKILEKNKIKGIKFSTLKNVAIFFVVSKKTINAKKILARMEKAYKELKDLGKL